MTLSEHDPGARATETGAYEELNVFGRPTGRTAVVAKDEEFPDAARGFSWRALAEHSVAELRARAAEYRRTAETARTGTVMDSSRKIAARFDALADQREQEERDRA
jgi:hypothetical protein